MTDELTPADVARQLTQGTRMLVDTEDQDWQMGIALLASAMTEEQVQRMEDEGVVVLTTDVSDHAGRWLNGRVPLPVTNMMGHTRDFWDDVVEQYEKIAAVMWPNESETE